ncbi:hypothetical protein HOD20_09945 [archaeon]|jgi:hypothetical protein|nr:hypothetical protein [archaeon]MBT4352831.1 hypothetical protein [archaeon]MBT4647588.1 hypothetical protein [archaeon]MBT6820851.1 hypothetical protein [archaeon]MBT7392739.1 hypothetical protein [archaeon]
MLKNNKDNPKTTTLREFKFQKRAKFIKDLYSEVNSLYSNFTEILRKKDSNENYKIEDDKFKKSYDELLHYHYKFNNVYIKDTEVNKQINNVISNSKELNNLRQKTKIKTDVNEIKNEFRENSKELITNFRELSYRLNDCGVMMWI